MVVSLFVVILNRIYVDLECSYLWIYGDVRLTFIFILCCAFFICEFMALLYIILGVELLSIEL